MVPETLQYGLCGEQVNWTPEDYASRRVTPGNCDPRCIQARLARDRKLVLGEFCWEIVTVRAQVPPDDEETFEGFIEKEDDVIYGDRVRVTRSTGEVVTVNWPTDRAMQKNIETSFDDHHGVAVYFQIRGTEFVDVLYT